MIELWHNETSKQLTEELVVLTFEQFILSLIVYIVGSGIFAIFVVVFMHITDKG